MHIARIQLKNFWPFRSFSCDFTAIGITTVHGRNESGKSQLLGSAVSALVGMDAIRLESAGSHPSSVRLSLKHEDRVEVLCLDVRNEAGGQVELERSVVNERREPVEEVLGASLRKALKDPQGPRLIMDDRGRRPFTRADLYAVEGRRTFEALPSHTREVLRKLSESDRSTASEGLQSLANVFHELAVRSLSPTPVPLLVDGLHSLDYPGTEIVWQVLEEIAVNSQVLIATYDPSLPAGAVVDLDGADRSRLSLASYGSSHKTAVARRPRAVPVFSVGEVFPGEEDRQLELKEVKGSNPVASIESVADQYVVAFLNAPVERAGRIVWGVRDADRHVVGVPLNAADRDRLRRVVTEKLHKVTPTLAPSAYSIEFHRVEGGTHKSEDLCLVEVLVPAFCDQILFATGKQEVYIKTDAGRKKLTALEIQRELIGRLVGGNSESGGDVR